MDPKSELYEGPLHHPEYHHTELPGSIGLPSSAPSVPNTSNASGPIQSQHQQHSHPQHQQYQQSQSQQPSPSFHIPPPPPPFPQPKKPGLSLNPLDLLYMISKKRKKVTTCKEVATELGKLEKLTGKIGQQQKKTLECLRDWGADLPEPETRELMSNMFNLLSGMLKKKKKKTKIKFVLKTFIYFSIFTNFFLILIFSFLGPLNVYSEFQGRLMTIHSHFQDLARMEDHNTRVENELKTTQKQYYKANYRDLPTYQIETYHTSYANICNEIDELHLRHRNRMVSMIKQSYQLVLQQMLDSHQKQKASAETGVRFLKAFDAEPKDVLPEGYVSYSVGGPFSATGGSATLGMNSGGMIHGGNGTGRYLEDRQDEEGESDKENEQEGDLGERRRREGGGEEEEGREVEEEVDGVLGLSLGNSGSHSGVHFENHSGGQSEGLSSGSAQQREYNFYNLVSDENMSNQGVGRGGGDNHDDDDDNNDQSEHALWNRRKGQMAGLVGDVNGLANHKNLGHGYLHGRIDEERDDADDEDDYEDERVMIKTAPIQTYGRSGGFGNVLSSFRGTYR